MQRSLRYAIRPTYLEIAADLQRVATMGRSPEWGGTVGMKRPEPMPWFVKLEVGLVPKALFDAVIPAHLAWLADLERKGHAPRSGYWADRVGCTGDGAGGMLVFLAHDWAEAEMVVQTDPLILEGCVDWTLHEWSVVFPCARPG